MYVFGNCVYDEQSLSSYFFCSPPTLYLPSKTGYSNSEIATLLKVANLKYPLKTLKMLKVYGFSPDYLVSADFFRTLLNSLHNTVIVIS